MPHIGFYETETGRSPVEEYIDEAPKRDRAKIANVIDLLEDQGTSLGLPFVKPVEGKLYELRIKAEQLHRIIFFQAARNGLLLLHAFSKKTDEIPPRELETARQRMKLWLTRRKTAGDG